jgi:hypothetical protein
MSHKLHDIGRDKLRVNAGWRRADAQEAEAAQSPQIDQAQFDAGAWTTVLEEQRLCIARAAGVEPSKVRIHVGH